MHQILIFNYGRHCFEVKNYLSTIFKVLIFAAVGAILFWFAYRGQDLGRLLGAASEARWGWILCAVLLMALSHYSRAVRWGLLLEPFGYRIRTVNLFFSIVVMYLANMVVPRSGEVVRCGVMTKYEKVKFSRSLGTVVTERIADVVVFVAVAVVVLMTHADVALQVLDDNPSIEEYLVGLESHVPLILLGLVAFVVSVIMVIRTMVRRNSFGVGERLSRALHGLKDGMMTVMGLKRRWAFVFHTLLINFIYFFTTYLFFKSFPFTEHLGLTAALMIFVLGTFGVIVPSPGGIGTWHFIVMEVLALYGVAKDPDGGAFALVAHGMQDLLFAIVGLVAMVMLPFVNSNYQPVVPDETEPNVQENS